MPAQRRNGAWSAVPVRRCHTVLLAPVADSPSVVGPFGGFRRVRRHTPSDPPVLSVVMAVRDVAHYIRPAIRSVLRQEWTDLEVVVVDDGSIDATPRILRRLARRDPRVTVITQANAGAGAARNRGMAQARGRYLVFADGDDVVPASAYRLMVERLESTGSDYCTGSVERFDHRRRWRSAWTSQVHATRRDGVDVAAFPEAVMDALACNRMYCREFWDEHVQRFPEGVAYEDHLPMLRATLSARAFDVMPEVVYRWRARPGSTGQSKAQRQNLVDRLEAIAQAWHLVQQDQPAQVCSAYLARVLDIDLPLYYPHAVIAADDYRTLLGRAVGQYLDAADARAMADIRVHQRIRNRLAADGRWADLERFTTEAMGDGLSTSIRIEDGEVVIPADLLPGITDTVDPQLRVQPERRSPAGAALTGVDVVGDAVVLRGTVRIRGVELSRYRHRAAVTVLLDAAGSIASIGAEVTGARGRAVLGFTARISPQDLPGDGTGSAIMIDVELAVDGLRRRAQLAPGSPVHMPVRLQTAGRALAMDRREDRVVIRNLDDGRGTSRDKTT